MDIRAMMGNSEDRYGCAHAGHYSLADGTESMKAGQEKERIWGWRDVMPGAAISALKEIRMSTAVRVLQGKFGRVALLDMDRPLVTHGHSQCHVLIKVSGEDTFFTVRDKVYPLNDQTAVLINSWEPHAYTHHDPDAPRTIILALYIEPLWLGEIEKTLIASGHPGFFPQSCVEISKPIRNLSTTLAMQMLYGDQLGAQQLETQLSNLMIAVVDAFSEWRNFNDMRQIVLPQAPDFRIRRAISFMRDNVGRDLDVDKLATEACLSRAHFFKLFQQHTGLTPHLYLNVLRMEAAIEGLTQSRQSLVSLSNDLGFSAQSHFTRFFQQHLGAVPSQYRKVVDVYADQE
jgi:AraC-like DNA-binding protein